MLIQANEKKEFSDTVISVSSFSMAHSVLITCAYCGSAKYLPSIKLTKSCEQSTWKLVASSEGELYLVMFLSFCIFSMSGGSGGG